MKVSEKIKKVNEAFTVNMYDNGFMVEFSGQNANEDWINTKIVCKTVKEVLDLIQEVVKMERNV